MALPIADRAPNIPKAEELAAEVSLPLFGPEVYLLFSLTFIYYLGYAVGFMPDIFWDLLVPASMGLACIYGSLSLFKTNPAYVLTAYFWFLVTCACYYGLGGAALYIGSRTTIQVILSFYYASQAELQKAHLIVATSITIVAVMCNLIIGRKVPYVSGEIIKTPEGIDLKTVGLIAMTFGLVIQLTLDMPYQFGIIEETSGLRNLSAIVYVGIVLLSYSGFGGDKLALALALSATVFEVTIGLLLFQKMSPIISVVMYSIGWIMRRPKTINAGLVVAMVMGSYSLLAPFAGFCREELLLTKGERQGSAFERMEIILQYLEDSTARRAIEDDYQPWLARLSYLNAQGFAVAAYDSGRPSNGLDNFLYVFIPRFIMPDKPIISDVGADFNEAVTGSRLSSTSPTIMVEGYYLYGWLGVFALMPVYGSIIGLYSRFGFRKLQEGKIALFPAILMMMISGMQNDNNLLTSTFGGGVIIVAFTLICAAAQLFIELVTRHLKERAGKAGETRATAPPT
jgi:hypothetical protein